MLNYRDRPAKIRYVAEELGIRYVLDGSFQRATERVRVHARLIDALTGKHLWADSFDKPWTDIFTLQDTITENIVAALEIKLTEEQSRNLRPGFDDFLDQRWSLRREYIGEDHELLESYVSSVEAELSSEQIKRGKKLIDRWWKGKKAMVSP